MGGRCRVSARPCQALLGSDTPPFLGPEGPGGRVRTLKRSQHFRHKLPRPTPTTPSQVPARASAGCPTIQRSRRRPNYKNGRFDERGNLGQSLKHEWDNTTTQQFWLLGFDRKRAVASYAAPGVPMGVLRHSTCYLQPLRNRMP